MDAVTVCVNYSDYLQHTLPNNRHLFDNYWVICDEASYKDIQDICKQYNAQIFSTQAFYAKGASFNKGNAINSLLSELRKRPRWVCHLDADICLNDPVDTSTLDKNTIYGCPRRMCPDALSFKQYLVDKSVATQWLSEAGCLHRKTRHLLRYHKVKDYLDKHPEAKGNYIEFFPIGYFQLFYLDNNTPSYPIHVPDASLSDKLFTESWKAISKLDIEVVHLPVIGGKSSSNWTGRVTSKLAL